MHFGAPVAGFFDTSGLDADPSSGSTNNAAADFARMSGENPAQFRNGIFERLFGRKPSKEEQHAQQVQAATASPAPPSPTMATVQPHIPQSPKPAISSGEGLIKRVLGISAQPPAPQPNAPTMAPGMPFSPQELQQAFGAGNFPLPPFQGIPQFHGAPPPQRQPVPFSPGTPLGDLRRRLHGGDPSVSADVPFSPGTPLGGVRERFQGAMNQPSPDMITRLLGQYMPPQRPPLALAGPGGPMAASIPPMAPVAGFFDGGEVAMRRGGYPANLMTGLPQRFDRGSAVPDTGHGDGRSDHVPAVLSPGEFVMDAETVSMLGNGSSAAGAKKLDQFRQNIRKQKGKALAKGKFSPDAKKPESYLKGAK